MEQIRLLICEDEGLVALDLERRLTRLGYKVVGTAPEGEEAYALAVQHKPDCVLMDIQLEGPILGTEVAAVIQQDLDIPSIYLTAYSGDDTVKRAERSNPIGYLVKPVNDRDLNIAIKIGLAQHRARQKIKKELSESVKKVELVQNRIEELSSKLKNNSRINSLSDIISGICHHFNNSLQGLVVSLDLLEQEGSLPEAHLETVRCSMKVCESHTNFIRRLTWASGRPVLDLNPMTIQNVVQQAVEQIQENSAKGISFETDLGSKAIEFRLDQTAICYALRAILMNSIEASPKNGKILVKVEEKLIEATERYNPNANPDWYCIITILDSGKGIPADIIERVTDPFFSTRSSPISTGLGLTEAYGIAIAHRGWLNIESTPAKGTKVQIFLPQERALGAIHSSSV